MSTPNAHDPPGAPQIPPGYPPPPYPAGAPGYPPPVAPQVPPGAASYQPPAAPPYLAGAPGYPPAPPSYPPAAYGPGSWPPGPSVPGVPALPAGVVLAPVGRRIGAYFLAIPLVIVTLGIGYIIWGLILWGRGTSPALSVLKLRCVKVDNGRPATFGTMALRNIVGGIVEGILSGLIVIVSFILFLTRADRRCLHDLIGGTVVVHDPQDLLGR
jgi:uncharacterized RDD family membrane protein YckC